MAAGATAADAAAGAASVASGESDRTAGVVLEAATAPRVPAVAGAGAVLGP